MLWFSTLVRNPLSPFVHDPFVDAGELALSDRQAGGASMSGGVESDSAHFGPCEGRSLYESRWDHPIRRYSITVRRPLCGAPRG
jgi:hypothetical protein